MRLGKNSECRRPSVFDMRFLHVIFEAWYLLMGALLITVAIFTSTVQRLPLTEPVIYLCIGLILGSVGLKVVDFNPVAHPVLFEHLAEIAVVVSLFTVGLKLRLPLKDRLWRIPCRLAFVSMTLTVLLVAVAGVLGLGLSWGAAILLGAILAPTDPVLASGIELKHPHDRSHLRFSLTGEAGLNDGTAFPFVMLGLGLLGLHELGDWGWRWLVVDVGWAIFGGLAIGGGCGFAVGRIVLYLRRRHREALDRDELLTIGLISLSYGGALLCHTYGFLAVFAAGLALRMIEQQGSDKKLPAGETSRDLEVVNVAAPTHPKAAPAQMARAVLGFNEQMERILEVALVLLVGLALTPAFLHLREIGFVLVLFLVIRPLAVAAGLWGTRIGKVDGGLICWFGIRGIGSIYYLMYAVNQGLEPELAQRLISLTLTVVVVSIVAHGITVTPLMSWYKRLRHPG